MARINGSANGNGNGKYPARASLGEVSQGEVPLGYNLNGEDDEIFDVTESKRMGHTRNDQKDMSRMGKRQELIRNFRPLSALSFAVVLQATWEFLLISNTQGLTDGGLAGLFWSYVWTFIGFGFVIFSLGEMASMAPISGGQYHWVSEFAPPQYQRPLSYITGWMAVLSWQAGSASGSFLTGTMIQGLIYVNNPEYAGTAWQGTLLVFAMVTFIFACNIWGARGLPMIQNLLLIVHVFGFLVVVIVLWTLAPRNSPTKVFSEFYNGGNWSSVGLALMIGQISAIYGSLCSDATAHMAEEVKDAGRNVPIAIVWSYVGNGLIALVFLVTFLFAMPSVEEALKDQSGFPFIYVFQKTVSTGGVNALTIMVLILVIASNVSFNASTSRQTFAFARDNGLPFAHWISHVHPTLQIPANAVFLSCLISALLSVINIGSDVAFNAIISLQVVALMFTYAVSISCVLYRRLYHPELLPPARWSLGRSGVFVNGTALVYVSFAFFWAFWPNERPVTLQNFNWAVVMFVGVFALSVGYYVIHGRKVYVGPVTSVEGRREDGGGGGGGPPQGSGIGIH